MEKTHDYHHGYQVAYKKARQEYEEKIASLQKKLNSLQEAHDYLEDNNKNWSLDNLALHRKVQELEEGLDEIGLWNNQRRKVNNLQANRQISKLVISLQKKEKERIIGDKRK